MAISIKHKHQSAKADSADTSIIRPSNWNDEHNFTMAASKLLGRHAATDGVLQEIMLGGGLKFDSGKLVFDGTTATSQVRDAVQEMLAGTIVLTGQSTALEGTLKANGAAVSRSTYSRLFDRIGVAFGNGNGTTTFNLPDLRGEFIRGWDDSRGVDTGRALGSKQAAAVEAHTHKVNPPLTNTASDTHAHGINTTTSNSGGGPRLERTGSESPSVVNTASDTHFHSVDIPEFNSGSYGGTETRPQNVALLACIIY